MNKIIYNKAFRINTIESGKFHCNSCNKNYRDLNEFTLHLNSVKHNPETKKPHKVYICECCNFDGKTKHRLLHHESTKKHQKKLYNRSLDSVISILKDIKEERGIE